MKRLLSINWEPMLIPHGVLCKCMGCNPTPEYLEKVRAFQLKLVREFDEENMRIMSMFKGEGTEVLDFVERLQRLK